MKPTKKESSMNKKVEKIAITGSILGICSGTIELIIGKHILPWIGNKESPMVLGVITILLSCMILTSIILTIKIENKSNDQKIGLFLMCFIPTLICFTTVGRLWYLPGGMLIISCANIFYNNWFIGQKKDKISYKNQFDKNQKLDVVIGFLLVLCIILHFFVFDFEFFELEMMNNNVKTIYQVMPMDFIRYINQSSFETIDYETIEVMITYLLIILGSSIILISSLIKSKTFVKGGLSVLVLGLFGFLIMIKPVLIQISQEDISYFKILSSLGPVYYIFIILSGMILLNKKRTHKLD